MAKNKKRADGRYSCQVYLGKGPDGKRKYKTFYGSTLREAKAAADDFRSAVSKGMDPEQAEATLGTLYDNLIAAKKAKGIGQKSIDRLATNKAHWGELVDVPASELRAADFQQVLNNLADWHDGKPPLSHFTLTNLRGSAKAAYDLAIPEIVMYNPLVKTITPAGYLMYDKCPTSEAVTYMSLAAVDDLPGQVGGGEYLPTEDTTTDDSVWGRLTPEADDGVELTEYTKNGLTIQLAAQNTGDTEASIRLPLFYYPGYHMTAADGAALTHKNGYLTVTLAPGWQGSVQVRWTGMWFWRAADCISLLGIAATVVLYRKSQKNAAHV